MIPRNSPQSAPARTGLMADYYSRNELAAELDVTLRTLERWAWLRTGPARTKVGGRVYYHKDAVRAWLASQTEAVV